MEELSERIEKLLGEFRPITLREMDASRLMNRIDTKYLFHTVQLEDLLKAAAAQYRVLSINGKRIFRYNSLYLDTPGLKSYLDHHNGIRPRYKVRYREYEDSGVFFLEVKSKIAGERTRKTRTQTTRIEDIPSGKTLEYLRENYPPGISDLGPSLWTVFRRITLVGTGVAERITLDLDLSFRHGENEKKLPFLMICEVKRDQFGGSTPFMKILKASRIYPASISKYCLGTLLLKKAVKYNRFKSSMLAINKLENVYRSDPVAG